MRRLFLLSLLLALVPPASCVDANALTLDKMSVTLAGDSIHIKVPLTVPSEADSARITLTLTPGGSQTMKATVQATALTFAFPAPAEGATVSFKACGIAYKKGVAGPNSCNAAQSYTRPITPPGAVQWPDTMIISALDGSLFVDTALIALTTGEICPAEIRDYHRAMLLAPHGAQTPDCVATFTGEIAARNLRTLTALAVGYPWTANVDSAWRADTTPRPSLPGVYLSTHIIPNPMSGDTFVFGPGANNVPIAEYRASHPGFTWGAS